MIQSLLRSRWLYVFAGLLVAGLYAGSHWLKLPADELEHHLESSIPSATPHTYDASAPAASSPRVAAPHAKSGEETVEWWPQELDRAGLERLAMQRPHLALLLSLMTFGGGALGLCGLLVGVFGVWRGQLRSIWRFSSASLPVWSFGEMGRLLIITLLIAAALPLVYLAIGLHRDHAAFDPHLRISVSMLILDLIVIAAVLLFAAGKGYTVGDLFGHDRKQVASAMTTGLRGYLVMFPWLFVILAVVVEVARAVGWKMPVEPIQELVFQESRPVVLGLTTLLACVVGPVAEELFFRGVVYTAIRRRAPRFVAMLLSGIAFALLHANPVGFLSIMLLGCLLAYLYERTGSLASSLAVHIAHNTLLMTTALVFRQAMASM